MDRIESREAPKDPHACDPNPHVLGRWRLPGGNVAVATFTRCRECRSERVNIAWRKARPLTPAEAHHYRHVLEPLIVRLVAEYTESAPHDTIRVRGLKEA